MISLHVPGGLRLQHTVGLDVVKAKGPWYVQGAFGISSERGTNIKFLFVTL